MARSLNPMDWSKEPSFVAIKEQKSEVQSCVLPMFAVWDDAEGNTVGFAQGTATMIGGGLALASKHVVEDFYSRVRTERFPKLEDGAHVMVFPAQMFLRGPFDPVTGEAIVWVVHKTFIGPYSDMAVLAMVRVDGLPRDERAVAVGLDLLPPGVGDRVFCAGYHRSEVTSARQGSFGSWNDEFAVSVGKVTEIFEQRRDSARLPFPCFETDMQLEGGMSGGPVFSNNGRVCGIAVSSLPPSAEGERHVSYFASLWPLMATVVDLPVEGLPEGSRYPLIELVKRGFIDAPEHTYIDVTFDGVAQTSITISAWEAGRDEQGQRYYRPKPPTAEP